MKSHQAQSLNLGDFLVHVIPGYFEFGICTCNVCMLGSGEYVQFRCVFLGKKLLTKTTFKSVLRSHAATPGIVISYNMVL